MPRSHRCLCWFFSLCPAICTVLLLTVRKWNKAKHFQKVFHLLFCIKRISAVFSVFLLNRVMFEAAAPGQISMETGIYDSPTRYLDIFVDPLDFSEASAWCWHVLCEIPQQLLNSVQIFMSTWRENGVNIDQQNQASQLKLWNKWRLIFPGHWANGLSWWRLLCPRLFLFLCFLERKQMDQK